MLRHEAVSLQLPGWHVATDPDWQAAEVCEGMDPSVLQLWRQVLWRIKIIRRRNFRVRSKEGRATFL